MNLKAFFRTYVRGPRGQRGPAGLMGPAGLPPQEMQILVDAMEMHDKALSQDHQDLRVLSADIVALSNRVIALENMAKNVTPTEYRFEAIEERLSLLGLGPNHRVDEESARQAIANLLP